MEITEQWIGKEAGGRVFKDARTLLKLRKVVEVRREGGLFQGVLAVGKRPMRVAVKVLGPHEVRNHCSCSMARRTGALCEHATALMLAEILPPERMPGGVSVGVEKNEVEAERTRGPGKVKTVAMDVAIAPLFPAKGVRAVHLRRSEGVEPGAVDDGLSEWLDQQLGVRDASILSLPEDQVGGFYRALEGHPRVWRGAERMEVISDRLCPVVELEVDGDESRMRLVDDSLLVLGSCLAEWDEDGRRLVVDRADSDGPLPVGWQTLKTKALVKMLPALQSIYQLPEDLGGLRIREANPGMVLRIAGSTRALQASLHARYPGGVEVALAVTGGRSDSLFPIPADDGSGDWWVRNREDEQSAVAEMMAAGFQLLDASGMMFLRGEDEVLECLTTVLPRWQSRWSVETEDKLAHVASRVERIQPALTVHGRGEDWLSCEMAWQCGDQQLSAEAVRKLLMSGKRSLALPDGRKAVLSTFDSEVVDGFLLDTDPRQESGRYLLDKKQAGYLERLQSFYDPGRDERREEEEVPDLPEALAGTLRDYQWAGVQWLYRRMREQGAALLADDMGLGKTLQALAAIRLWKQHGSGGGPALVVCPATLLGNWRDEAKRFVPELTVLVMHGPKRKEYFEVMEAADVIITSYALLDRDQEAYAAIDIGVMVLDEASAIRNPDTLAAKAACGLRASARIAISGTPVENGVRDLWSIFQFLMPGYLGGREDFRLRYELPCQSEVPDMAAVERLRWRTSAMMLRRTKQEVAKDLPPKLESVVWCDPSARQREHYQSILRHGVEKVEALRKQSGEHAGRMQMLTVLLRLRQSCCDLRLLGEQPDGLSLAEFSSKLARLMELLAEAQRGGHRVLVFSQFTSMLALIREALDDEDIDFCYLDGATQDRSSVVKRFQQDDGPPVFLISLKAGGYGLTLTAADTVVLFDPWWNPAVEAQAADRIHRIGQTKPATIYKMITRGTVEEKILRLQEKKRQLIRAAVGDVSSESAPLMRGLNDAEMRDLLS